MESIELLIDLWAIVGIGLEIWGFWWLLKYGKMPTKSNLKKFLDDNIELKNKIIESPDNVIGTKYDPSGNKNWEEYAIENVMTGILNPEIRNIQHKDIEDKFRDFWEGRKNLSIKLVIIGLIGQIVQIIHEDALQIIQSM